jgi:hypothetical protein
LQKPTTEHTTSSEKERIDESIVSAVEKMYRLELALRTYETGMKD